MPLATDTDAKAKQWGPADRSRVHPGYASTLTLWDNGNETEAVSAAAGKKFMSICRVLTARIDPKRSNANGNVASMTGDDEAAPLLLYRSCLVWR